MKELVIGMFDDRTSAERAINALHRELDVDAKDISYVYRSASGSVSEQPAADVMDTTPGEGATRGAVAGGAIGGLAGLAIAAGMIPVIGPVVAAGPLVAALGIGGAIGTTAAGAVTGAAAGGIIGALMSLGVDRNRAEQYQESVAAGHVLVAIHTNNPSEAAALMSENEAVEVESYALAV